MVWMRNEKEREQNPEIEKARTSAGSALESRARELESDLDRRDWDDSPLAMIEREIALVLDQIRESRELENRLHDSILNTECAIGTELAQMEERTPRYSAYRFPEREKLQRRQHFLDLERRRFTTAQAGKMQILYERLLSLLQKRAVLDF